VSYYSVLRASRNETIPLSTALLIEQFSMLGRITISEPLYDILIEDADGRYLWLESLSDLSAARERLQRCAADYTGMRLILWDRKTRTILLQTEGY
jgi:hypothetical protein